jgi:hypothetical protein
MAAFADYLDLKFAVADQVNSRSLSDVFPRLVTLAETALNRELRCKEQITRATLTLADGTAALPSDFLEMISVFDEFEGQMRASSIGTTHVEGTQYGRYALDGASLLINGYSGDRDILYYAALPTLTTSASASNWLLAGAPDVYLYAVSIEAAKYLRDAEQAGALAGMLASAMTGLKVADDRARWANATVRVMGPTP